MILLVDLCWKPGSLSHDEFVGPVARIVRGTGEAWREVRYAAVAERDIAGARGIILCGTALKDNAFAERAEAFAWLREAKVPVLGICAGMQALCLAFGGSLRPGCEIGMTTIRACTDDPLLPPGHEFAAYELHSFTCDPPPGWRVLAASAGGPQAIRHPGRPVYGVMFHPEVRHDAIVERFLALCREEDG